MEWRSAEMAREISIVARTCRRVGCGRRQCAGIEITIDRLLRR
jgi:hypothetical protein